MTEEYIENNYMIKEHYNNRCVFCGRTTRSCKINICDECLKKYEDRELLVKVGKIRTTIDVKEIIEKYNEFNIYRCIDGHKVKSEQERDVDNYLYNHKITHAYELEIDEKLHPDFYIPEYDIYIEYWSSYPKEQYFKESIYKLIKYKEMGLTVLGLYWYDIKNNVDIIELMKQAKRGKLNKCKEIYKLIGENTKANEIKAIKNSIVN